MFLLQFSLIFNTIFFCCFNKNPSDSDFVHFHFLPETGSELGVFSIGGHSLMCKFFFDRDVTTSLMSSGRLSYFECFFPSVGGASGSTPGVGQNF